MNVLKADRNAVYGVLALVRAVIAAGNGNGIVIEIKRSVRIIYIKRDLAVAVRTAGLGAAENYILHRLPAQTFGRLLSEHPSHRVGYIALAAAVRAYDRGYTLAEFEYRFIGKGFKALYLNGA